jgi:hypothetical protein
MKVLVILMISWIDGSHSAFELEPSYECGMAMDDAIAQAAEMEFEYERMECIYTDTIIVSPRPRPRPAG